MIKKLCNLSFISLLAMQCSIKTPEVNITGEKTALENQVLGSYKQIESEAFVIASTRDFESDNRGRMSSQKQEVLAAVQNRKFNKDDIDEFKRDGVVGENNRGYLTILPTTRYETDDGYKKLVDQIVSEENHDRQVIYERVTSINQDATEAGEEKLSAIFAKLRYDNSEAGTKIQATDGSWYIKPE
jgi:uncharacterized protein YdbL (DUF1318 family)